MQRTAQAVWHGTGKEGSGTLTTPSGVMKDQPYSFKLRFVDESGVNGTNPEELIAAAHAGCFTMALSFQLAGAGFTPDELKTQAVLTLEQGPTGFSITGIVLKLEAKVPGIDQAKFEELAGNAKAGCPVSRALAVPITLDATLLA
jgi:lipoyl-dependent peroxiredoxin